jgi:hypothetical protein
MELDLKVLRYWATAQPYLALTSPIWALVAQAGCANKSLSSANRDIAMASTGADTATAHVTAAPMPSTLARASIEADAAPTHASTAVTASALAGPGDSIAPASPSAALPVGPGPRIVTIGMHAGGGPFDEATKVPFKRAVEPAFAKLRPCFELLPKPQTVNVGVDLLVPIMGGRARVTRPRSSIKSAALEACVVRFFEDIEFEKPQHGPVGVSYSLKMSPR